MKHYKQWFATHLKSGAVYNVIGEATNASNKSDGEMVVIYERDGLVFVREVCEFMEKFEPCRGVK